MSLKHIFIDFDETLASSAITWGMEYSIPKLLSKHNLHMDEGQFARLVIDAIRRTSSGEDMLDVTQWIFREMGWQSYLQKELLDDVMSSYQPALFDDVLPFLARAQSYDAQIYIISNNPRTHDSIKMLNIADWFDKVFTPATCDGAVHKPDVKMWQCVQLVVKIDNLDECVMIGDDPWSDADFATNVGLNCFLVDRKRRYELLDNRADYQWVRSLLDIQFE